MQKCVSGSFPEAGVSVHQLCVLMKGEWSGGGRANCIESLIAMLEGKEGVRGGEVLQEELGVREEVVRG